MEPEYPGMTLIDKFEVIFRASEAPATSHPGKLPDARCLAPLGNEMLNPELPLVITPPD